MRFDDSGYQDKDCYTGGGDPQDGVKNKCRANPTEWDIYREVGELECKFPFFYNGIKYDKCILFTENTDLVYRVFWCPIRDTTTKIDGINSFNYTYSSNLTIFCRLDPEDEDSPLTTEEAFTPALKCTLPDEPYPSFPPYALPFAQCKNNCPGGNIQYIFWSFKTIIFPS